MLLEWFLLAEGAGTNAVGSVTIISINANVVATPIIPVQTKRVVVLHFTGEPEESAALVGKDVTVSVQVVSPSGHTLLAHSTTGKFAAQIWPELPSGLDIIAELPLRITEYGIHDIVVSAQFDAHNTMEGRTRLYVMEPPPTKP